jgi:cell division protein FtsB
MTTFQARARRWLRRELVLILMCVAFVGILLLFTVRAVTAETETRAFSHRICGYVNENRVEGQRRLSFLQGSNRIEREFLAIAERARRASAHRSNDPRTVEADLVAAHAYEQLRVGASNLRKLLHPLPPVRCRR